MEVNEKIEEQIKISRENGCKLLECKTIDNNIALRRENIKLKSELETYKEQILELKQENHTLKEKLENFIPRRRVRRIYKQVKKILEQDGIVDDLEEEEDEKVIEKYKKEIEYLEKQSEHWQKVLEKVQTENNLIG